jgi:hypothetical protein
MAFKQRSSGLPFKEMGSSPAKQAIGGDAGEVLASWNKNKSTKSTMPKNFNMSGKDTWTKRSKEILKKAGKKASKGNILALMLGSTTTATADQPVYPKDSAHYQDPKKKIDFTSED